jgi:hypothetical protein
MRREWVEFCKQEYGVSTCTADKYWARGTKQLMDAFSIDRRQLMVDILDKSHHVYRRSLELQQPSSAQAALALLAKLGGLTDPMTRYSR